MNFPCSYALNNPLIYTDPTGNYPAPNPEGSNHGENNHGTPPWSPTGNYTGRNPFPSRGTYPGFENYFTWLDGTEGSGGWVHNSNFTTYSGQDASNYYAAYTGNVGYLNSNIGVISDQVGAAGSRRVVYDNGLVVTRNIGTGEVMVEFGVNIYGDQFQYGQCGPLSCMDCHGKDGLYYNELAPVRQDFNLLVLTLASSGIGAIGSSATTLTFGQRLFINSRFGITSTRFGNSVAFAQGSWNVPGSVVKLGWSTTSRYGGGYAFRLGIGGTGNISRFHFYVPRTFVPNSYANPSIMLKRALFVP